MNRMIFLMSIIFIIPLFNTLENSDDDVVSGVSLQKVSNINDILRGYFKGKKRDERQPIVLVPGLAGSVLEYKKNQAEKNYGVLFLDIIRTLTSSSAEAYGKDLAVKYDSDKDLYSSNPNLYHIRPRQGTEGLKTIVGSIASNLPIIGSSAKAFKDLVELLKEYGYRENKDLLGATWDFRLHSYSTVRRDFDNNVTGNIFITLKKQIEEAYHNNNNRSVVLVSHSCGSCLVRTFLTHAVDEEWCKMYIYHWISANGAFGGAPVAPAMILSKRKWAVPTLGESEMYSAIKFFAAVFWVHPTVAAYGDEWLIRFMDPRGNHFQYAAHNISLVFDHKADPTEAAMQRAAANRTLNGINNDDLCAANVNTTIMYSTDNPTLYKLDYGQCRNGDITNCQPTETKTPGDATVPLAGHRAYYELCHTRMTAPDLMREISKQSTSKHEIDHISFLWEEDFMRQVLETSSRPGPEEHEWYTAIAIVLGAGLGGLAVLVLLLGCACEFCCFPCANNSEGRYVYIAGFGCAAHFQYNLDGGGGGEPQVETDTNTDTDTDTRKTRPCCMHLRTHCCACVLVLATQTVGLLLLWSMPIADYCFHYFGEECDHWGHNGGVVPFLMIGFLLTFVVKAVANLVSCGVLPCACLQGFHMRTWPACVTDFLYGPVSVFVLALGVLFVCVYTVPGPYCPDENRVFFPVCAITFGFLGLVNTAWLYVNRYRCVEKSRKDGKRDAKAKGNEDGKEIEMKEEREKKGKSDGDGSVKDEKVATHESPGKGAEKLMESGS